MRRLIAPAIALLILVFAASPVLAASPAVAVTQQRTWHATFGRYARLGSVVVTAWTNDTGLVALDVKGLRARTFYRPEVRSGTCARPGTVLTRWNAFSTSTAGTATTYRAISQAQMNSIWGVARPGGAFSFWFLSGSTVVCGNMLFTVATKVTIPSYGINLPIVPGPSGYPYCNVAMYQKILWQPTEPGVTFIYAHARTGMFLPLLTAWKVNNGAAMIGRLVYVYTSNSMVYTYRITGVDGTVTSVQKAVGITTEQLWLQTSTGPNFTYPKLVVVATRIASAPATYAASHPVPHIVHCT